MANPITWRNVVGPSLADAARPLDAATRTLNGAFDQLQSVLKEREAIDAGNVLVQQENQKNAFLDMLHQYKTPEEIAAAQASGAIQQRLAELSPQARAAVRGAEEQRLGSLRDLVGKSQQYQDQQLERQYRPMYEQALGLAAKGDAKAAMSILEANPNMPGQAALMKAIVSGERDLKRFGWDEQKHQWAGNQETRNQSLSELNQKVGRSNLALNGLRMKEAQLGLAEKEQAAADRKAVQALQAKVGQELTAHQDSRRELRSNATAILASRNDMQFNSDGSPALETLDPEKQKVMDTYLKSQGIKEGLDVFTSGDTEAAERIMRGTLRGVAPHIAQKVIPLVLSGVDSSGPGLVGIDAKTADSRYGETAAAMETLRGRTWYAPGSKNALNAYEEVLSQLPNLIDKTTGFNPEEDIPALATKLREVATKGVKLSDGSYMVPSIQDIKAALAAAPGGQWFNVLRDQARTENFEAFLRKNMSQPEIDKMRRDAQLLEHWDRKIDAERATAERKKRRQEK